MNIGIILRSLECSQIAYEVISTINAEISNGSPHDYRIFFENLQLYTVNPLCAVMNVSEIWSFDGLLISTTIKNTALSLKTVCNTKRIFWSYDLDFLRDKQNYLYNLSIYRNNKIDLFTRSKDASDAVYNFCNRKPNGIMPEINFLELVKLYVK